MTRRHRATAFSVAACLLLLVGLWLLLDNPAVDIGAADIGQDRPAGEVTCSIAPYDAGFNHNDEPPGGEHSRAFTDEAGPECYAANMLRFRTALGCGVLSLLLLVAGAVAGVGAARVDRTTADPADAV